MADDASWWTNIMSRQPVSPIVIWSGKEFQFDCLLQSGFTAGLGHVANRILKSSMTLPLGSGKLFIEKHCTA